MCVPFLRAVLCLVTGFSLGVAGTATGSWQIVDPLTQPGWQHFYNNEFNEALVDFQKEADRRPNDPQAWNQRWHKESFTWRWIAMERSKASWFRATNPFWRRA